MKKPVLLLLCALLLLAGCGGEESLNWTPAPATPTPSPAVPPEDASWWTGVEPDLLPTELGAEPYVDGDVSYRVYAAAPEGDLFLYEVRCALYEGVQYLLRLDGALGEPLRLEEALPDGQCGLARGDYDGDGAQEYALTPVQDTGTGLILCELEGEDWTFRSYAPGDYSAELSSLLDFRYEGGDRHPPPRRGHRLLYPGPGGVRSGCSPGGLFPGGLFHPQRGQPLRLLWGGGGHRRKAGLFCPGPGQRGLRRGGLLPLRAAPVVHPWRMTVLGAAT